jgi:hypothetical protein
LKKVEIAVCESIPEWNTGAGTKAEFLDAFTTVGSNSLMAFRKLDSQRINNAERKVLVSTRHKRQKQRGAKKSKGDPKTKAYLTGSFGLGKEPEVGADQTKEKKPKQGKTKAKRKATKRKRTELPTETEPQSMETETVEPSCDIPPTKDNGQSVNITFVDDNDVLSISNFTL